MEAIILAGGLGRRLSGVVSDVPKPMAAVQGRPFLACLLDHLASQGVKRVILSIGHMAEVIEGHFGPEYRGVEIAYVREAEPLGTGGAIRLALQEIRGSHCFILNGDTFFDVDLVAMHRAHCGSGADLTMALKPIQDISRYGCVECNGSRVEGFREKHPEARAGLINGGIYLASAGLLDRFESPAAFSFEKDFLALNCSSRDFTAFVSEGFFIDIGVPEDYQRAQSEPKLNKSPHSPNHDLPRL